MISQRNYSRAGRNYWSALHLIGSPCVITDVVMPGMNGFALYDALRQSGFDKPVIFMTGALLKRGPNSARHDSWRGLLPQ
ncbi:hypothetical protein ACU4GD_32025 [Cupriavidus basilensis]